MIDKVGIESDSDGFLIVAKPEDLQDHIDLLTSILQELRSIADAVDSLVSDGSESNSEPYRAAGASAGHLISSVAIPELHLAPTEVASTDSPAANGTILAPQSVVVIPDGIVIAPDVAGAAAGASVPASGAAAGASVPASGTAAGASVPRVKLKNSRPGRADPEAPAPPKKNVPRQAGRGGQPSQAQPRQKPSTDAPARSRNASGRFVSTGTIAKPKTGRDASGRFLPSTSDAGSDENGAIAGAAERIASAVSGVVGSIGNADAMDPLVAAWHEVSSPISGLIGAFSSDKQPSEKTQNRWWRRLYRDIGLFRKDEREAAKRTGKTLTEIRDKPVAVVNEHGMLGRLLMLLASLIPGLSKWFGRDGLPDIDIDKNHGRKRKGTAGGYDPSDAAGTAGGGKEGGKKPSPGDGKGKPEKLSKIKAGLRKVPLIGALIAGGLAALSVSRTESDDSLSRREKDVENSRAISSAAASLAGAMAGAAAGTMVGGPIGTVIGGVVGGFLGSEGGEIIGGKIGEYVNDMRDADFPGRIMAEWERVTGLISSGWKRFTEDWNKLVDDGKAAWLSLTSKTEGFFSWIGDLIMTATGISKESLLEKLEAGEKTVTDFIHRYASSDIVPQFVRDVFSDAVAEHEKDQNPQSIEVGSGMVIRTPIIEPTSAQMSVTGVHVKAGQSLARFDRSSVPAPVPMPGPVALPDPQPISQPQQPAVVVVQSQSDTPGRGVSDSRIAHIQSAGLSD